MKTNSFVKNLILHIRYPWTACCLLIMWVGLAILCAVLHFSPDEIITLVTITGVATLLIAFVGFRA